MSHYDDLGGETGIRALVERFYDLMDTAPEAVNAALSVIGRTIVVMIRRVTVVSACIYLN